MSMHSGKGPPSGLKRSAIVLVLAFVMVLAGAGTALASHIYHYHSGLNLVVTGSCQVDWEHVGYNTPSGYGETDEDSGCDNVQAVMRWYHEDVGWITSYGPQQNNFSSVSVGGIINISYQLVCGNAICKQKS